MKIISAMREGALRVSFDGELDHHTARNAIVRIGQLIDIELPRRLILDFERLSFTDSSGIAVVINAYRKMTALGGELLMKNVPQQAVKVLSAAGIGKIVSLTEREVQNESK